MYTCSLQGCKSAWGESDSMVNHLRGNKLKHNKNYITYHMNDPQGASLTKDMVMDLSVQLDNEGLDSMRLLNECTLMALQGYSYDQLIGWVDLDLGSSTGWWPIL